jgi:anti-anti-sigma regulatory factor
LLLDLSATPRVDLQAAEELAGLAEEVRAAGIRFQVVEAHASVRELIRQLQLEEKLGTVDRRDSLHDEIAQFLDSQDR